jgi:hypothetical protein
MANGKRWRRLGGAALFGVPTKKLHADLSADLCESLMSGQRPVARVDCVNLADLGRGNDVVPIAVVALWRLTDTNYLVCYFYVFGIAVLHCIDRNCFHPCPLELRKQSNCDVSVVRD